MNHSARSWVLTRWLFLRALGVVSAVAVGSLWVQLLGLVGSGGISPVGSHLDGVGERLTSKGQSLWWGPLENPSLVWLDPSDAALNAICVASLAASALLVVGIAEGPALLALWVGWLSLCTAGQQFLGFQWDSLLAETLFLAMFWAPWHPFPKTPAEPPAAVRWLLWLLLFRLMFFGGLVKVLSGDPTWRNLSAMNFHYFTQPLPNPASWYAHQLHALWHQLEVIGMFLIELVVPFAIPLGRPWRHFAATAFSVLLLGLLITGNYGYFQLLGLVLCLTLFDDGVWAQLLPRRVVEWAWGRRTAPVTWKEDQISPEFIEARVVGLRGAHVDERNPAKLQPWRTFIDAPLLVFIGTAAILTHWGTVSRYQGAEAWQVKAKNVGVPEPVVSGADYLHRLSLRWRIVNGYGLFATMSTDRSELTFEGSVDGKTWVPWSFRYKPALASTRPPLVAPHMPRLDWQLWFAVQKPSGPNNDWAGCKKDAWVLEAARALGEGRPEVLALVDGDPFGAERPKWVRVSRAELSFTAWGAEDWWIVKPDGLFCPATKIGE